MTLHLRYANTPQKRQLNFYDEWNVIKTTKHNITKNKKIKAKQINQTKRRVAPASHFFINETLAGFHPSLSWN